jgi:hypothetical protein
VEIIPGQGSGQLKKHVLRFLNQAHIRALYHRIAQRGQAHAPSRRFLLPGKHRAHNLRENGLCKLSWTTTGLRKTTAISGASSSIFGTEQRALHTVKLLNHRHGKLKRGTLGDIAIDPDLPAVRFDRQTAKSQP